MFFCDEDIYEGDDYYVLNGFDCYEECLNVYFKFTAEAPDYEALSQRRQFAHKIYMEILVHLTRKN